MKRLCWLALLLALLCGVAPGRAQDVTVGEPVWYSAEPAPAQLPEFAPALHVAFPTDVPRESALGYAIVTATVDVAGRLTASDVIATAPPFANAVRAALDAAHFRPAMGDGHAIPATVYFPVVFNPRSASVDDPNASPRLLAVSPAFGRVPPKLVEEPPGLSMRLRLDTTGKIVSATPQRAAPAEVERAVRNALQSWRLAPARRHNWPLNAEIVLPVLCVPVVAPSASATR
jgi:hypothetical protein